MSIKQRIPVIVLIIWFAVITAFMLLNQALDLEVFFVLALIGLLVVVELIDTATVQPRTLRRIKYVIAVGVLLFGYIVVNKIMGIIAR